MTDAGSTPPSAVLDLVTQECDVAAPWPHLHQQRILASVPNATGILHIAGEFVGNIAGMAERVILITLD